MMLWWDWKVSKNNELGEKLFPEELK